MRFQGLELKQPRRGSSATPACQIPGAKKREHGADYIWRYVRFVIRQNLLYILNIDYTNKSHLTQILIAVITIISYNIHTKLRPLIPHLLSVRERVDAGGVNRPARLPPCDGVLWPTGPDTSRRLHYAYRPEVGRRWERMSPARCSAPRSDPSERRQSHAKDVRLPANIRKDPCPCAVRMTIAWDNRTRKDFR